MVVQSTATNVIANALEVVSATLTEYASSTPSPTDTSTTQSLNESVVSIQGVAFNVDAIKSTYKVTTIGSNFYRVWFKDVEDNAPMEVEEVTKGLVRRTSFLITFYSLTYSLADCCIHAGEAELESLHDVRHIRNGHPRGIQASVSHSAEGDSAEPQPSRSPPRICHLS